MSMRRYSLLLAVVVAVNACGDETLLLPEDEMDDVEYSAPASSAMSSLAADSEGARPGNEAPESIALRRQISTSRARGG